MQDWPPASGNILTTTQYSLDTTSFSHYSYQPKALLKQGCSSLLLAGLPTIVYTVVSQFFLTNSFYQISLLVQVIHSIMCPDPLPLSFLNKLFQLHRSFYCSEQKLLQHWTLPKILKFQHPTKEELFMQTRTFLTEDTFEMRRPFEENLNCVRKMFLGIVILDTC